MKVKQRYLCFCKKNGDFVTFDLGGHVTLWLIISTSHNILRCLTHQKIRNCISFRNMCISTISRYAFCDIFAFSSCPTFFFCRVYLYCSGKLYIHDPFHVLWFLFKIQANATPLPPKSPSSLVIFICD